MSFLLSQYNIAQICARAVVAIFFDFQRICTFRRGEQRTLYSWRLKWPRLGQKPNSRNCFPWPFWSHPKNPDPLCEPPSLKVHIFSWEWLTHAGTHTFCDRQKRLARWIPKPSDIFNCAALIKLISFRAWCHPTAHRVYQIRSHRRSNPPCPSWPPPCPAINPWISAGLLYLLTLHMAFPLILDSLTTPQLVPVLFLFSNNVSPHSLW